MIPGLDDYLRRLERELRLHGLEDPRILEEAHAHLIDAVEDARHRGLSAADAECEALERFGAPEAIAAHMVSERDGVTTRFAAALDTVWQRKWWILAPTALAAVVTSVMSYYFLPTRYRSETTILVVSQRVPADFVRPTVITPTGARLQQIEQRVSSRTRLERIIEDFGLYEVERKSAPVGEVVEQMRRDIHVDFFPSAANVFGVSFVSSDPKKAMQVTERLASFFILTKVEDSRIAANLERRQIGEQFRILDSARLPEQPVGPDRRQVNAAGTFAGFGLGLAMVSLRRRTNKQAA